MCRKKEEGGLGFHDIERFNQALLGKQAWRVLDRPNALVSKVLKSRYFPNTSFLDSGLGTRPSYAWRSIMHGKELLMKGLVRSIGDGLATNVWRDKWIMDTIPRPPISRGRYRDESLMVADLIDLRSHTWDVMAVRNLFIHKDAEHVLNLKLSRDLGDVDIWGFTKDGKYRSQSGYKFLESSPENQLPTSSPISPLEKTTWTQIWKLQTLPKIKHFFWRALSGALAVGSQLRSRGIQADLTCKLCRNAPETICHALFKCQVAHQIWMAFGIPLPPRGFSRNSVLLNIHHLLKCIKSQRLPFQKRKVIPWILWYIWKGRNAKIFENISYDSESVINKAQDEAEAWFLINNISPSPHQNLPVTETRKASWSAPESNFNKCNIGVSWINRYENGGAAWIVRNHNGQVLFHARRSFSNLHSLLDVELQSLLWAMESLKDLHMVNVVFEMSIRNAQQAIQRPQDFPLYRQLLNDINRHCRREPNWSIIFSSADANIAAQKIATSVTRDRRYQSYIAQGGPRWLHDQLRSEAILRRNVLH